jgi:hypothetical protein
MLIEKISETTPRRSRCSAFTTTFGLALILFAGSLTSEAADRTRPTTPGAFRVTRNTAYTVSLAWKPSTDNSGNLTYRLWGANGVGPTVVLPQTETSYKFTALYPSNSYTFGIYAQDAAGNISAQVTLSTTTVPDTTPPSTAPAVSVMDLGSNYASVAWTPAQDDGPYLFYEVWVNGCIFATTGVNVTSTVLRFLEPQSAYTITVRGYDYGNNRGPFSLPLAVTTTPPNPNDHTPPTTPAKLSENHWSGGGDTEIHVRWAESTDNFDAQANIRYDIYVNCVYQDSVFGSGGPSIVYGNSGTNLIWVMASDTAGNTSPAGLLMVNSP